MINILKHFKEEAAQLAAGLKTPSFYEDFEHELTYSHDNFFDHPLILRLQEDVIPFLYDDYGHGIAHAKKVAIEAGALVLGETKGREGLDIRSLALLAQIAGLLHDTCRLEPNHAAKGAEISRTILQPYPLSERDKDLIAFAIANHEAFTVPMETNDEEALILSHALYDADKFRWGTDNFVTTLWEICDYEEWTLAEIVERFPQGLVKIQEIADTFRTGIGRKYGPEFIELGMKVGRELLARMERYCAEQASEQKSL